MGRGVAALFFAIQGDGPVAPFMPPDAGWLALDVVPRTEVHEALVGLNITSRQEYATTVSDLILKSKLYPPAAGVSTPRRAARCSTAPPPTSSPERAAMDAVCCTWVTGGRAT